MAVISIKNKTKSGSLLVGNAPFIPNDYESIATVNVGSGGASYAEFTSIPSTYTHLQIRTLGRGTRADVGDGLTLQFNSDTASNYSSHYLYGNGASVFAGSWNTTNIPLQAVMTAANATSGIFGVAVTDILDYANTNKYKTTRDLSGNDRNGAGDVIFQSGSWRSTSAITSIKISPLYGAGFAQYSQFALYGIKG
jgi:hypothetical protein